MIEKKNELGFGSAALASEIVVAYVSNNSVPMLELPSLLRNVYSAISRLNDACVTDPARDVEKPTPAQIRKSIRDDGIVSFIDGKTYKTLKRHLSTHGLDPRSYRERYGLPAEYPMVAPSYAEQRSQIAKAIGLGRPSAMSEAASKARRKVL
ncbi:MucR family transcriptional regulator [Bradyrhizobium sp. P5_C11_2]